MFDIPELDEMICSELAPHDLIQCTQVNEQWHRVVTPYIWRDITHIQYQYWSAFRRIVLDDYLQERQQQQRLRLQSPKSSSSSSSSSSSHPHSSLLAKYSPYIRKIPPLGELLIVLRSRYNPAHPPPRSVKRRKKVERKEPTEYDLMRHLIKHCCSIDIEGYSITTSDCDSLDVFETTADFILPVVRRLFVTDNNIRFEPDGHLAPWKLKYMLSRCSSKLEKLKLTSITLSAEDEGSHAEENEGKEPISGFQPKELSLYKYKENPSSIEFWSWLWRRCGSLERLKVYLSDGTVESLADGMLNHMPNLSEIHLGQSDKEFHFGWAVKPVGLLDKQVAAILSSCSSGWRIVEIRLTAQFHKASMAALVKHCPTLEVLVVGGCNIESRDLVLLLSSSYNLRSFVSIDNAGYTERPLTHIKAQMFIDLNTGTSSLKKWACEASLKVLKVKITGIPRPDLGRRRGVVEESYAGQGREIQNRVYERLARFTNLEKLWLGHNPRAIDEIYLGGYSEEQRDCLEMSLESGLRRLEGLKELRELVLLHTNTRIRLNEVQWMAEHWPKLRLICGLPGNWSKRSKGAYGNDKDEEKEDRKIVRWLQEHCPRIQIQSSH